MDGEPHFRMSQRMLEREREWEQDQGESEDQRRQQNQDQVADPDQQSSQARQWQHAQHAAPPHPRRRRIIHPRIERPKPKAAEPDPDTVQIPLPTIPHHGRGHGDDGLKIKEDLPPETDDSILAWANKMVSEEEALYDPEAAERKAMQRLHPPSHVPQPATSDQPSTELPRHKHQEDQNSYNNPRCSFMTEYLARINSGIEQRSLEEKFFDMGSSLGMFFRGSIGVFYHDFLQKSSPFASWTFSSNHTVTFISGDQHVENFATFENSVGKIVYDIRNFDETWMADYQLDVWRMATSLLIHAADNNITLAHSARLVYLFSRAYLKTLAAFVSHSPPSTSTNLTVTEHNSVGPLKETLREVKRTNSHMQMLKQWCPSGRFRQRRSLVHASEDEVGAIKAAWNEYGLTLRGSLRFSSSYFTIKDIARHLNQDISSLGKRRYWVLIEGPTSSNDDDIILDVHHVPQPTWKEWATDAQQELNEPLYLSSAERALQGSLAMGRHVDPHLGWMHLDLDEDGEKHVSLSNSSQSYLVRRLPVYLGFVYPEDLRRVSDMAAMATQWGAVLATAHARGDNEFNSEWITWSLEEGVLEAINGRAAEFEHQTTRVALQYFKQVRRDFLCFRNTLKNSGLSASHMSDTGEKTSSQKSPPKYHKVARHPTASKRSSLESSDTHNHTHAPILPRVLRHLDPSRYDDTAGKQAVHPKQATKTSHLDKDEFWAEEQARVDSMTQKLKRLHSKQHHTKEHEPEKHVRQKHTAKAHGIHDAVAEVHETVKDVTSQSDSAPVHLKLNAQPDYETPEDRRLAEVAKELADNNAEAAEENDDVQKELDVLDKKMRHKHATKGKTADDLTREKRRREEEEQERFVLGDIGDKEDLDATHERHIEDHNEV